MPITEKNLDKERDYYVVKANQLITKSRYSLSLQQQKILLYFISQIKPEDNKKYFQKQTFLREKHLVDDKYDCG